MSRATRKREQRPSRALSVLAVLLIIVLWIHFVGGTRRNEMLVGTVVTILTAALLSQVWRIEAVCIEIHASDVFQGWRVPWYVLRDTYVITLFFFRDLLGWTHASSLYRVSGIETDNPKPRRTARQVLITLYTTMSPNSIVLGIDPKQDRILFHQLQRSSISKMGKALGVRPGVKKP